MNHYIQKFKIVRLATEKFTQNLSPEDMVVQVMVDASPIKWHLAHTTWFFETFILKKFVANYQEFHPEFNYLFNSYYESVGKRLLRTDRGNITRPSINSIFEYRAFVNNAIIAFLENGFISKEVEMFLELGLQHEQQHQELMVTDLKYVFGNNPTFPSFKTAENFNEISSNDDNIAEGELYSQLEEGVYAVGYQGNGFCFDNELPHHKVYINPVAISNKLISNEEYLAFINDGGYDKVHLWLQEGWAFIKENHITAPLYWFKGNETEGAYHRYSFTEGLLPLDLKSPVCHISYYEAQAFANWKGMRLPTEFEWEVWAQKFYGQNELLEPSSFIDELDLNINSQRAYDPKHQSKEKDMYTVWNWTQSAYLPYPKYKQEAGALGEYNGKFMVNQMVLRGASCATLYTHSRLSYRNFFHPDKRWQFTGIRLAKDL